MTKRLIILFGVFALSSIGLYAVSTSFYSESGIKDFETGNFEGITVNENGELSLAAETRVLLDKSDLLIWDLVKGSTDEIYASSGTRGRIWKISPAGASLYASLDSSLLQSLAFGPDKKLYAANSSPAQVIRLDGEGQATIIAEPSNTYVHAMEFGQDGRLYLACGNPASLERLDPKTGKLERLALASRESHFLSMAIGPNGVVYLGSDGNGVLYKYGLDKKLKALYDCYENEVSSIVLDREGGVFFATASQRPRAVGNNFVFSDSLGFREPEQRYQDLIDEEDENQKKKKTPLKNSVYRLNLDDSVDKVFTLSDASFHSLAFTPEGDLLIGSGSLGVLYKLSPEGVASRYLRVDENQILNLLVVDSRLYLGTGNDGRVRELDLANELKGVYTSRVLDCRANVNFGSLSWNAVVPSGSRLKLFTRSGNTNPIDESWSPWSGPYTRMEGERITSPRARFVQYKIEMEAKRVIDSPILYALKIPFVHDNRQPRVRSLNLVTYSEAKNNKNNKLTPGQCALSWLSEDDDNDLLETKIYFKLDNSAAWRYLKVDASQNQVVLNSEMLPDGWYQFRVVVSDRPSNHEESAKTAFADSRRVLIDNTPPVIENLKARVEGEKVVITGRVIDRHSHVSMIRYALNGDDWLYAPSADGIFDSLTEEIRIELPLKASPNLLNGSNLIMIRACDQQENWATASLEFSVKLPEGALGLGSERRFLYLD